MSAELLVFFLAAGALPLSQSSFREAKPDNFTGTGTRTRLRTQPAGRQAVVLTGRVVNEAGAPVPGVTITIPGSPTVASTNAEGQFLLPLPTVNATLVFRSPGYRVQSVQAPTIGSLTVTLYALTGNGTDANTLKAGETIPVNGSALAAALPYADEMPAFVGGDAALHQYLVQKTIYPAEAKRRNLSGTVVVRFIVDERGRITEAEVAKGCGNGFDEEALRLIRLMPWWTPGRQASQPVRVVRTMPIIFRLSR